MKKIIIIGNLGADCKINTVNGRTAINFSIAENESYTDKNGVKQEITTWYNCAIWRNDENTRLPEFLKKGTQVYIEGNPRARLYTTQDHQQAISNDITVNFLQLLGSATPAQQTATPANQPQPTAAQPPTSEVFGNPAAFNS